MSGPGHVPRATCRQSGGHGSLGRWSSAGAARGQFVTNNTKYRQVHPLPPTAASLLGKCGCGCVCVLRDSTAETKGGNIF